MLHIEFEVPDIQPCHCCGQDVTRLTRFVYQDGDALAYCDALLEAHSQPRVVMCEWDAAGHHIIRKTCFPLRILSRRESLLHPLKADVFHIADHISAEDLAAAAPGRVFA